MKLIHAIALMLALFMASQSRAELRLDFPKQINTFGVVQDGLVITSGTASTTATINAGDGWIRTVNMDASSTFTLTITALPQEIDRYTTGPLYSANPFKFTPTEYEIPVTGAYRVVVEATIDATTTALRTTTSDEVFGLYLIRER